MKESGCNAILVRNYEELYLTDQSKVAFLHIVNKEAYEEIKHSAGGGANIPVLGAIIGGSVDYEDFLQKRQKEFDDVQYTKDEKYSLSLVRS